jgi:hypothetical protein
MLSGSMFRMPPAVAGDCGRAVLLIGFLACAWSAAAMAQSLAMAVDPGPAPLASDGSALLGRVGAAGAGDALPAPRLTVERTRLPTTALSNATVDAAGRPVVDVAGVTYRWWLRRGRTHFGIGLGALGQGGAPFDATGNGAPTLVYAASTLTVGLRYQLGERSTIYADASGARPIAGEPGAELFATKLGVEWAGTARSRLGFEKGALGLQLDSGYRMSLRVKNGGVGVYVRGKF